MSNDIIGYASDSMARDAERDINEPRKPFYARHPGMLMFIVVVVAVLLFCSFAIVGAGQRGVLVTLGSVSPDSLDEGLHLKLPFLQSIKKIDVRTVKFSQVADSASSDLQDVQTTIALNYHVNPDQAALLYQEIGRDYESRIVLPAIQDSLKSVTATYTAEELITKRPQVKRDLDELLRERLGNFYLSVDSANFENFQFSEEFDKAVEAKVTAEQEMRKAEMDLKRIEIEAQQEIERGKAEAEKLRLQRTQITPDLLELRRIEAQIKAIEVWDGKLPMFNGGGSMPFIDFRSFTTNAPGT